MSFFPEASSSKSVWTSVPEKKSVLRLSLRFLIIFFSVIGFIFTSVTIVKFYSMTKRNAPAVFERGTVLRMNLDMELAETRPTDFIGSVTFGNMPTLADAVLGLHRAANDPNITTLIAYMTNTDLPLVHVQEIRDAVRAFREKGKKTVFYTPSFGELGGGTALYYLASAFEEIWMQPGGELGLSGMAIETPYFKNALLKWGVKPSFEARYEYKSGADSLGADKMSVAEKENLTKILNSFFDVMAEDIGKDRNIPAKRMKEILKNGPYFEKQALEMKLVDKVEYADVLEMELKKSADKDSFNFVDLFEYTFAAAPRIKDKDPVIAYIPAVGIIQFGESLFAGSSYRSILGSSSFSAALREAADDDNVKAIVVRIDSPGGGYTPSDAIRREMEFVRSHSKKPIVCSMGSTAASGGYFISLGCDRVLASPSTLTGSIGVFGGKLVFKDLLNKLNINVSSIKIGKNAGMFSMAEDFSAGQKAFFNASLDRIYQDFTKKVADKRGLSLKETDAVARGRVFTGAQAEKNKLIDQTGGISDSLKIAAEMANVQADFHTIEFPLQPSRLEMLINLLNSDLAVSLRKSVLSHGFIPSIKLWFSRLSEGDFRLFYNGLTSF